jgi:nucleoside-diphosphate-sugar epimerase
MKSKQSNGKETELRNRDLVVITGAGGFIGGNLVKYFLSKGFMRIRAVKSLRRKVEASHRYAKSF